VTGLSPVPRATTPPQASAPGRAPSGRDGPADLLVRILGPVVVEVTGGEIALGGRRARAVLAALAVDHDRWVDTDELIAVAFAGAAPPAARNSIQSHVSRLRAALRAHGIGLDARRGAYRLRLPDKALDLDRFRTAAERGERALASGAAEAGRHLREALAWWRGPAFGDLADLPRLATVAAALHDERQRATELWFDAELGAGRHAAVLADLRDAVDREPHQERPHGQLMVALYRSGRPADALAVYRRFAATVAERGSSPGPELRDLERRIVAHDASLRAGGWDSRPAGAAVTPAAGAPGAGPEPELTGVAGLSRVSGHPGAPPDPTRPLPFVGRQPELGRLLALAVAPGPRPTRVVVIEGEAGIGKSRLVGEATARAAGPILRGGCSPDLDIPYEPLIDVLAELEAHGPADVAAALAEVAADLAPLHPRDRPGHDRLGLGDPALDRYRLLAGLRTVLASGLGPGGGTLVVEDLHWATAPTVAAIRFLSLKRPLPGCLVVLTLRPPETRASPELAALLGDLARSGRAERLALAPLSDRDLASLLGARTPAEELDEAVRSLRDQTGGVPLLVEIALTAATDHDGEPGPRPGQAPAGPGRDVLAVVRGFVAERVARFDEATRTTLALCAVVGSAVDVAVLAAAGGTEGLDRLRRAGLLREVAAGSFVFAHELTRAAVLADLGPSLVARLHEEVALAIQSVHGPHAAADRLAAHWLAAARPETAPHATAAACRAAELALARVAPREARRWALAGLDLLPAAGVSAELEVDLYLALAEAAFALGDHEERRSAARRAGDVARALDDPRRVARAAIAFTVQWVAGPADTEATLQLGDALGLLGDGDPVLRARLLAMLAGLLAVAGTEPPDGMAAPSTLADEAVRLARRALAAETGRGAGRVGAAAGSLAGRTPAAQALANALTARIATRYAGPYAAGQIEAADEIAALGREYDDRFLAATAARFRATPRLVLGDRAGFEKDVREVATFAAELDFHEYGALAAQWQAMLAMLDGRLDDVEASSIQAVELSSGHPNLVNGHQTRMAWLARERDQLDGVLGMLGEFVDAHPTIPAYRSLLALFAADAGRTELAREQVDRLARDDFAVLPRDGVWAASIAALVEVAARLRLPDRAARLAGLLQPYAGQLVVIGPGVHCTGAVDRFLGLAAATLGEPERARRAFAAALDVERAAAAPLLQGWTRFWRGTFGPEGSPSRSADLLAAGQTARDHGLALLDRRVREALHGLS
jgi:DNA-binding SARP family transcriptional activator